MTATKQTDPALADLIDWIAELAADDLLDAAPTDRKECTEEKAA